MRNILLFICFCLSVQIIAQTKSITGVVIDTQNEAITGVSVIEEGTTNGTITDLDGNFSLNLSNSKNNVVFRFMGYKTQSIVVGDKSHFSIVMQEEDKTLDEVVVTGYSGTQLRSKVTSSISKVGKETLEVGLFSNPAQALSGAVSGLRVIQSSGNPGAAPSIILRGGTNLDGTGSPLIVVDGQIRSSMSDINPEDIESMDVLKDAGATAIYGARASNGVVLITTKMGKSGKTQINFKAKVGLNYLNSPFKFVGARDYLHYQRTAVQAANELGYGPNDLAGQRPYGTGNKYGVSPWSTMYLDSDNEWLLGKGWETMPDPLDPSKTLIFKNTDPADTNFNSPAISQDYNINMSGGNDKGSYYAGLGYNHSEGLPIKSFYNLVVHAVRKEPQLDGFIYGVRLQEEDKQNLLQTGHAGRLVEIEPVKDQKMMAFLSVDKLTNELVAVRADKIKIPNEVKGVTLNDEQKKNLSEGKAVYLEGMTSKNDKMFNATVQINADRRSLEFKFDNTPKQNQSQQQNQQEGFRIPTKLLGAELSSQQQKDLKEHKTIYVTGMTDKVGEKFNAYIKINTEKEKLDFFKWNPDRAKKQGAEVKPDNASNTQVAVNSEGKTNEATKNVKEPLKNGQTALSEKQQEKKEEQKKEVKKSKGIKM